jgi:hypothetical protein
MALIHVRIIESKCNECLGDLVAECKSNWRSNPSREDIYVPEEWLDRKCPHGLPGIEFEGIPFSVPDGEDFTADAWDVEGPDGWLNLDSTKNIGYPAREDGRYGSHPTYDRFDGDSEP